MKKFLSKTLALSLTLAMLFSVTLAHQAFAADVDMATATADAENVNVPTPEDLARTAEAAVPYAHKSYYPISGVNSGAFTGLFSEGAVYSLPGGTMKFAYSFYGGSQCYLRFYYGTGTAGSYRQVGPYNAANYTGSGSISLTAGTYTVVVYNPYGGPDTLVNYAFNLYTD